MIRQADELQGDPVQKLVYVLRVGPGDRDTDLYRRIKVDIEVGADQLHQLYIFEINHVYSSHRFVKPGTHK